MEKHHHYKVFTEWTGNKGEGTSNVRTYDRTHTVTVQNKPLLVLTTDNPAVGDKTKLNPEDLLLTAISSCHMLSYLYVCAMEGVIVTGYSDIATGLMIEHEQGGGNFTLATLNPVVTVAQKEMVEKAINLHHKAHEICYIANSVNFEVRNNPICRVEEK
jgi:organic hydroperoxide reductase OsmC/OhrA